VCFTMNCPAGQQTLVLLLPRFPIQQDDRPDDIDHHQARRKLVKLVKSYAARVVGRQARGEGADPLLDRVDFPKNDETRVESNHEHERDNSRPDGKRDRSWPEQGHCGECQQRQCSSAVGNIVKTRENCAEYSAPQEATGRRLAGLKDLKCGRRDHRAQYDHPA